MNALRYVSNDIKCMNMWTREIKWVVWGVLAYA